MIKEMLRNKDLIVFWTAMVIAACDVLSSGFFAIQEVVAAPSVATQPAVQAADTGDLAAQRWARRMEHVSAR